MNGPSDIIDNFFNLLAIATTVAAFVPALVYSYSTTYFDKVINKITGEGGMQKSDNDEYEENWIKRIIGFSHSIDLILILIIFVIFFTSIINFILYVYSNKHEKSQLQILSDDYLLSLLVISSFIFLLSSIAFWIYTIVRTCRWRYKEYWLYKWIFILPLFLFVIIYSIILCWFSLKLCNCIGNIMDNVLIIVAYSTIMIIGSVVLWIIPIIIYQPLFKEIKKALEIFDPKNKKTE